MPLLPNSFEKRRKLRNLAGLAAIANRGQRGAIAPRGSQIRQTVSANNLRRSTQNLDLRSPRSGVGPAGFKTNSRDRRVVRSQGLAFLADKANRSRFQDDIIDQPSSRQGGSHGLLTIDELQQKQGIEDRTRRDDIRLEKQRDFNRDLDERDFQNELRREGIAGEIEKRNFEAGRKDVAGNLKLRTDLLTEQQDENKFNREFRITGQTAGIAGDIANRELRKDIATAGVAGTVAERQERARQFDKTDVTANRQIDVGERALKVKEAAFKQQQTSASKAQFLKQLDKTDDASFIAMNQRHTNFTPDNEDEREVIVAETKRFRGQGMNEKEAAQAATGHVLNTRQSQLEDRRTLLLERERTGEINFKEQEELKGIDGKINALGETINSFSSNLPNRIREQKLAQANEGIKEVQSIIDNGTLSLNQINKAKKEFGLTDADLAKKFPTQMARLNKSDGRNRSQNLLQQIQDAKGPSFSDKLRGGLGFVKDAFSAAVIETGGTYGLPTPTGSNKQVKGHDFEILSGDIDALETLVGDDMSKLFDESSNADDVQAAAMINFEEKVNNSDNRTRKLMRRKLDDVIKRMSPLINRIQNKNQNPAAHARFNAFKQYRKRLN